MLLTTPHLYFLITTPTTTPTHLNLHVRQTNLHINTERTNSYKQSFHFQSSPRLALRRTTKHLYKSLNNIMSTFCTYERFNVEKSSETIA